MSAVLQPEAEHPLEAAVAAVEQERRLPWPQRLWQLAAFRRGLILVLLGLLWEFAARQADNELLFPGAVQTLQALGEGLSSGELLDKARLSLSILLQGYALGVAAALLLTTLAISTRLGRDLLATLTAMFNPLPAIALLPVALLWFGLGPSSLLFVLMHAVLWPLALATLAGFEGVPEVLRMAGRNYGLRGPRFVLQILLPAALPAILSGLRIAWAFAWRTLIAAELFFGASSGRGGLGWYIFKNRAELQTDRVFAGLLTVVLIGLLVESLVFNSLERLTVRRWGQQRA